jgi:hypothetical protein
MSGWRSLVLSMMLCVSSLACDDDGPAIGGDGGAAATVAGTVTLPGSAAGKPYAVRVLTMPGLSFVAQSTGTTTGGSSISYTIAGVPAGRYFLLAFVDVDSSGGDSSTPGDYAGWYGHGGDGNPPGAPNVDVPTSGTVRFDFSLVLR